MYYMWDMNNRTTEKQARKNRDRSNGKKTSVEDITAFYDADDVHISMASSGRVYAPAGSDDTAVGTGECSHGGHDRCICGMAEHGKGLET